MKNLHQISIIAFLLFTSLVFAQRDLYLEKKINERKVDTTYTIEERANIYMQFYRNMKKMNMSDSLENDYSNIFLNSVAKMARLDDKDKDFTPEERKAEFLKLVDKMNIDLKKILNDDQYKLHEINFNDILRSVYRRANWDWDRE